MGARGPQQGWKQRLQESAHPAVLQAALNEPQMRMDDPLQRHRDIKSMPEAELRVYARVLGLSQRDCELSVERLRVNCMHRVMDLLENL